MSTEVAGPAGRDAHADLAPVQIRVALPAHLRQLARCDREVIVSAEPTQRRVLDAVEQRYPMLVGTIRDPRTGRRRPFIRIFACEQDLSHDSPDLQLPPQVCAGDEPLRVVGAMAGG